MLKINELKAGDIVRINDAGLMREGIVVDISREEHQALVDNGVQEFWYGEDELQPVLIDDRQLAQLGFEKELITDGTVKYKKGPFRIVIPGKDDFSRIEIWYREDHRHFNHPIGIHELQNHHMDMTKVPLEQH
jgi:hypothetical protein